MRAIIIALANCKALLATFEKGGRRMVPEVLEQWDIDTLINLLTKGYFESEEFDFKETLPHSNDEGGKLRLIKTCCAFANSSGGFLIFGVSNSGLVPVQDRLVGIDSNFDFPEHFGSYPQKCMPSVTWDFKNPPISLENGKVIHIVYIPKSWNAPHSCEVISDGRFFAKRTNKGNEPMSYEEIRLTFLQYYEKRLKLQLLKAELDNIKKHAEELIIPPYAASTQPAMGDFSLTVLETVLADTYTILAGSQELLDTLVEVRNRCGKVNISLQIFYKVATPEILYNVPRPNPTIEKHNMNVADECRPLLLTCSRALELLEKVTKI